MKKITLFLLMLFSFTAFAQFPESFETTVPPAGWASFRGTNGLGTGFDWSVSTVAVFVQEGVQSAFVRYEAVTGGSAEDWLVSPMHTVTAPNTLLTFYQRQQYTVDYGTTYDIRVSTTSQTDHATFTTVLSQTEADLNLTTMTVKSVDLSAYVGQSIYIAFVMTNNDGDNWAIDNVNMESSVAAPGCATLLTPADGATIPVGLVNFSWEAPTTGDAPTSYDFYYGIAPDAVDTFLGNYTNTSIDVNVNDYSFTFYWKIVPKNLGGSAIGCPVWTFTTQDPPGYCLSAPNGQWPTDVFTPTTCDGLTANVVTANGYAGEYSVVNVTSGETYIFSSGTTDFITLSSDEGTTATAFGITPLTWVADVTGEVRFYSHVDDQCGDEAVNRVRSIVCGVVTADSPDYVNLQFPSSI
ncbi:MAG TPA: choice-of-anchor J domain-containing protein, partial [Flavobacterium sp.]|nr:choice-of-anchor J domain-containing protein [Flavobacterium sp.]